MSSGRIITPENLSRLEAYQLMTSVIVPRPIAWVATRSASGVDNIAPFSFFSGVSTNPPIVCFSVSNAKGGAPKDTLANIRERRCFSISVVRRGALEKMHASSAPFPPELSEFDEVGVDGVECEVVEALRVAETVAMECVLEDVHEVGGSNLVFGRVVAWHIPEGLEFEGGVDPDSLDPVGRLGSAYCELGALTNLPRATT